MTALRLIASFAATTLQGGGELLAVKDVGGQTAGDIAAAKAKALCALAVLFHGIFHLLRRRLLVFVVLPVTLRTGWLPTQVRYGRGEGCRRGACASTWGE